jgi:hypothetical protein
MKVTDTGAVIYDILSSDTVLKGIVGDRIFPMTAKNGVTYPFIAYRRSGLNPINTKDGEYQSEVVMDVVCASTDYKQSVEIVNGVLNALPRKRRWESDYKDVESIIVTDAFEDYIDGTDGAFVQILELLIIIYK